MQDRAIPIDTALTMQERSSEMTIDDWWENYDEDALYNHDWSDEPVEDDYIYDLSDSELKTLAKEYLEKVDRFMLIDVIQEMRSVVFENGELDDEN